MTEHDSSSRLPRRSVLAGAAWSAPVIVAASAAPAAATSVLPAFTIMSTDGDDCVHGRGYVVCRLNPDPPVTPNPVVVYSDTGATTSGFTKSGTAGTAGLYNLNFTTSTRPVPPTIDATITVPGYGTQTGTVTMDAAGTIDTTYLDGQLTNGGSTTAYAVVVQAADQRVLIGGNFTSARGTTRGRLARFNTDGSLDTTFADPQLNGDCYAIALQPDGKVLIAGAFTQVAGTARGGLARLNANGSLDTTFADPQLNAAAWAIALQPDGKVIVGGHFTQAGATTRGYVARFTDLGALDTTFVDPQLDAFCFDAVLQSDGKLVVCGDFGSVGGTTRTRMARLTSTGALDTSFVDPQIAGVPGAQSPAGRTYRVAVAPDGSVFATGEFTNVGGVPRAFLAKFTSTGALDTSFSNPFLDARGRSVTAEAGGTVLVTGDFANVAGVNHRRLARLSPTGAIVACWNDPSMIAPCLDHAIQSNGKVVAVGGFTAAGAGSTARGRVARFHA